jgi:Icc-related predicted phosphoesterase
MRILFSSDLHGHIGAFKHYSELLSDNSFALGILSGDLTTYTPDKIQTEQEIKSILQEAQKPIIFIMGNDDGILEHNWRETALLKNPNLKKIEFKNFNFVGYQYSNPFVGGPFEKSEKEQLSDLPKLKSLIDSRTIFISHGPALGILDKGFSGENFGSKMLRRLIAEQPPLFHLFGHIHQSAGVTGRFINGAYPLLRKFISIDPLTIKVEFVE